MSWVLIIILIFLLPVLYDRLFPFQKPILKDYFIPGRTFTSAAEGVTNTVIRQEGEKVFCEVSLEPHAAGPPEHFHRTFDESATVINGILTVKAGGQVSTVNTGERILFKKGVPHTMYNETDSAVIIRSEKDEDHLPVEFAYSLAQLYPLMQREQKGGLRLFAKMSVLGDLFDTTIQGPPPAVVNFLKNAVRPYARLFGVTPYDDRSRPH